MHLWEEKHGNLKKSPTEFELHVMNQGYEVEGFARKYLEKYVVNADEGEIIQFQKSFSDKQYLAITDVLIFKPKSNTYDLYEIKSSTRNKKEFVADATFQYLVVNKHVEIDHVFILHLNKDYSRYSLINLENLFIVDDITDKVQDSLIDVDIKRGALWELAG